MKLNKSELTQAKDEYKVEVRNILKSYKHLSKKKSEYQDKLDELNGTITVSGFKFKQVNVQTSNVSKTTESYVMKKLEREEELKEMIDEIDLKMMFIKDAVECLRYDGAQVVRMKYMDFKSWRDIEDAMFISMRQGQNILYDALSSLAFLMFGNEAMEESLFRIS